MWQDKLKEIIYILENSNVNEIEIKSWGHQYRVVKNPGVISNSINNLEQPTVLKELKSETKNELIKEKNTANPEPINEEYCHRRSFITYAWYVLCSPNTRG